MAITTTVTNPGPGDVTTTVYGLANEHVTLVLGAAESVVVNRFTPLMQAQVDAGALTEALFPGPGHDTADTFTNSEVAAIRGSSSPGSGNPFVTLSDLGGGGSLTNPVQFKGGITLPANFPDPADVKSGWFFRVLADVTDSDVTKTNTGQVFLAGDEIMWNGTNWTKVGPTPSGQAIPATIQTTDATPTVLDAYSLPPDSSFVVDVKVSVKEASSGGESGGFGLRVVATRIGAGAAALVGAVQSYFVRRSDPSIDATLRVSGNDVEVEVTGLAATTLNWVSSAFNVEADG